jgi:hypothetical protein
MFETSNIILLCPVDVSSLVEWITAIPFEDWPQQNRLADGKIRPAMVTDRRWNGFAERVDLVTNVAVTKLLIDLKLSSGDVTVYNRWLSVVMPGHSIPPHADRQDPGWICRMHVPLVTNEMSWFCIASSPLSSKTMEVGTVYAVNVRAEHWIVNEGPTPRIHFMFDVRRA